MKRWKGVVASSVLVVLTGCSSHTAAIPAPMEAQDATTDIKVLSINTCGTNEWGPYATGYVQNVSTRKHNFELTFEVLDRNGVRLTTISDSIMYLGPGKEARFSAIGMAGKEVIEQKITCKLLTVLIGV